MKAITVGEVMTPSPHTINGQATLAQATALMRTHGIRHLPVLHRGALVGVLSERDVALVETFRDVDPGVETVEEAMTSEPYVVDRTAPLAEVCSHLADRRQGSVVVRDGVHVVGIFTTVDACRVLASTLRATP